MGLGQCSSLPAENSSADYLYMLRKVGGGPWVMIQFGGPREWGVRPGR